MTDGRSLRIGIDLDNTLACYERLFAAIACDRSLLPAGNTASRIEVRDGLRAEGKEHLWTEIQGEAYGPRMQDATLFDGALDFLARCRDAASAVFIVSHRSRHPYSGAAHDLHAAARQWLACRGVSGRPGAAVPSENVRLEPTAGDKLAAIAALECTHFIDDLPELFDDRRFPSSTTPILFDPTGAWTVLNGIARAGSWNEVEVLIFGQRQTSP